MGRTINSPGVEINEIDVSTRTPQNVGTRVLINGFTDQGPSYEPIELESISHYEKVFGNPVTIAERYSYNAVKSILNTSANVTFLRLPYGDNYIGASDEKYVALFYPTFYAGDTDIGYIDIGATKTVTYEDLEAEHEGRFYIGRPIVKYYSEDEYVSNFKEGNFVWGTSTLDPADYASISANAVSLKNCGFVVVNKLKSVVNGDFEGYYIGITDNKKASIEGDTLYDSISGMLTTKKFVSGDNPFEVSGWDEVPNTRMSFPLTGSHDNNKGSMSESIEKSPDWDFGDSKYDNAIVINLFKTYKTGYNNKENVLGFTRVEKIIGCFDATSTITDPNGFGQKTFDIETLTNSNSEYVEMYVNPNFKKVKWVDDGGAITKSIKVIDDKITTTDFDSGDIDFFKANAITNAYSIGSYMDNMDAVKIIGKVPTKLELALRTVEDWREHPLDIVLDNGLSTIYTTCEIKNSDEYDDTMTVDVSANSSSIKTYWNAIANTFASMSRKDCMFIMDTYRNILVDGRDYKIEDKKGYTFTTHIYPTIKELVSIIDTSYGAIYGQWIKGYDNSMYGYSWYPYSAYQAAIMAKLDKKKHPWYAPAGIEDGVVTGALDVALNTKQSERDLMYRICINPVVHFPNQGVVAWGQKTLQKKPSAFDRINVRRLFLTLEKATRSMMEYFVFQQNSSFTRTQVVNTLTPILEVPKNNQGIVDYKIVCDERNNTPTVIDNNELRTSIYIKPVKTAEYILVDFYATRTDQDFKELM